MEASISDRDALRRVVFIIETQVGAIERLEARVDMLTQRLDAIMLDIQGHVIIRKEDQAS